MQLRDIDAWDNTEKRRQEMLESRQSKKRQLHAEAKEISEQFSEENKKLALKMNLEKVREVCAKFCFIYVFPDHASMPKLCNVSGSSEAKSSAKASREKAQ